MNDDASKRTGHKVVAAFDRQVIDERRRRFNFFDARHGIEEHICLQYVAQFCCF